MNIKAKEVIDLIENDDEVMTLCLIFESTPVWPIVRHRFLTLFINFLSKRDNPFPVHSIKFTKYLQNFVKSYITYNPYFIKGEKELYFFNSGITNVINEDGRFFNRVTDEFYLFSPKNSVLIESLNNRELMRPRIHGDVYSLMPLYIWTSIKSKFYRNTNNILLVSRLIEILKNKLSNLANGFDWGSFENISLSLLMQYKGTYNTYYSFFSNKKPKLIFLEDASYGGLLAAVINAAKKLNIKVCELQHGFVNQNHLAYNYGRVLITSKKYIDYAPDFYLTYGEFWAKNINIPGKTINIGNPYLEKHISSVTETNGEEILVLSSGVSIEDTKALLGSLLEKAKGYNIIFRPHPGERLEVDLRYGDVLSKGVKLDINSDLYKSFITADIVVGELSTGLFEAKASYKQVFLFMTDFTLLYYNDSIKHLESFYLYEIEKIFTSKRTINNDARNYYWKMNWKDNYRNFLLENLK